MRQWRVRIGGQYWDAMIWTTGAWNHYLYTGDKEFLALALGSDERIRLARFERRRIRRQDTGLFRGPGWSDGVAGYPDEYADAGGSSSILDWPKHNPDKVSKPGYGIPMEALSTNCIYYNAYVTAEKMSGGVEVLRCRRNLHWDEKAANLKKAINKHFWNEEKGNYRYLGRPLGQVRSSGRARLGLRHLVRHRRRQADRGDLQEPAHHARRHPLRLAELRPLRKQRRKVVRPAHRHRLAADSGLLGRGRRAGGQTGNLRP